MSDERNDFTDNCYQDKFSITRVGLKLDEGIRDSAYNGSIINHYIPNMLVNEGSSDLVILTSYPLGAGYPLDILSFVAQILRPGGFFLCYVPTILTKWAMPNVDSHVDCIIAIASRFGLIIPSEGELAKTYDDHTPLIFQKKQVPPRWQLGHLSDPGFVGFSKLFRDSFQLEPNPPLWNWKYGEGRGRSVIATRGGRLIAHYGSTLRAVSVFGDVGTAIQICDVMVDPHERGVMTRQGAMYITTTTFLEIYLGLLQYDIAYGFPNRRHMQLGERLGLYAEVARMVEIRWRPTTPKPSPGSRLHALNADSLSYQGLINKVWSKMAKDLAGKIVIIRDWDYIKYRYFRHPTNSYSVFGVISRWTGKLEGVIVLRQENQMCELVDMVVPLAKLPKMIDQACRVASRWGCESLYCWCTDYHAPLLATHAGVISPLDISVPASLWPPGRETAHLKDKWWLMSGDTEFR
jgi:hypothetical protein